MFDGLGPSDIVVVTTAEGAERAYDELKDQLVIGFDTESKPVFRKGEKSTGPHVAQFSTLERGYIFQLHEEASRRAVRALLTSETVKKVGFGLANDLAQIPVKLRVKPRATVDLDTIFINHGYGRGMGVKVAVAIAFKKRFIKSKKASTSNWMAKEFTDKQILYAANDAYAAIKVYDAIQRGL